MNEISRIPAQQDDQELIRVLQNSLYPGAKEASIRLVLGWCRATGRDPMKKPIHIVPMSLKNESGQYEYRDVLMPGIGTYRTDAAHTGEYCGKSEPEFGPERSADIDGMTVTFPEWCRVTVYRHVHGQARAFTARELWRENYAAGKSNRGVNDMWRRRPYGQLAKVAESQALRMAFPDETGNSYTAEEMEGKSFGPTLDGTADAAPAQSRPVPQRLAAPPARVESKPAAAAPAPVDSTPGPDPEAEKRRGWLSGVLAAVAKCRTVAALQKLDGEIAGTRAWLRDNHPADDAAIADALVSRHEILATPLNADDPFVPMPEIAGAERAAG